MAEDKPKKDSISIEWIIGSAIALFMLIVVVQLSEALKAKSDSEQIQPVAIPALTPEQLAEKRAKDLERSRLKTANEKCYQAIAGYQNSLRFETKRKLLVQTAQRPGYPNQFIQKHQFTNKLGFRHVVECTITDPLAANSQPSLTGH